ncbi:binding-protein-dependent transport periplasmic protein [Bordetella pertussis]|nr:binding-protein-dependent transport periplasmic protein [Bordetella pertussis]
MAKTEVVDPHTVRITLKEPFSAFINALAHPAAMMISPAALQKYGKEIGFHPVGTGPFKFVEWKPAEYLKVEKFDGYWRKGYPKVDTLTFRTVTDNNTRAAWCRPARRSSPSRFPTSRPRSWPRTTSWTWWTTRIPSWRATCP